MQEQNGTQQWGNAADAGAWGQAGAQPTPSYIETASATTDPDNANSGWKPIAIAIAGVVALAIVFSALGDIFMDYAMDEIYWSVYNDNSYGYGQSDPEYDYEYDYEYDPEYDLEVDSNGGYVGQYDSTTAGVA